MKAMTKKKVISTTRLAMSSSSRNGLCNILPVRVAHIRKLLLTVTHCPNKVDRQT
jgi:hypothetical protein